MQQMTGNEVVMALAFAIEDPCGTEAIQLAQALVELGRSVPDSSRKRLIMVLEELRILLRGNDDLRWCKCGHQACVHLEDGCAICAIGKCRAFDLDASRPIPTIASLDDLGEFDELVEPLTTCVASGRFTDGLRRGV